MNDDFAFSEQIGELAKALAQGQASARSAKKTSTNPHFRNRYADLAEVSDVHRECFAPLGLAVSQWIMCGADNEVRLCTLLTHSSGQWIRSVGALPAIKRDPQAYGSALTYARRYALAACLGIAADDDDGEAASRPPPAEKSEPRPVDLAALERDIKGLDAAKTLAELDAAAKRVAETWPLHRDAVTMAYTKRRDALRSAA